MVAQYKLGLVYGDGNAVPRDEKGPFRGVLASVEGQEGTKDLAKDLASRMTQEQAATLQRQAQRGYQQRNRQVPPRGSTVSTPSSP
jgi:hypothetical protein